MVTRTMKNGTAASFLDNSVHGEDVLLSRELSSSSCLDAAMDGVTHCEGGYASGFTAQTLEEASIESLKDLTTVLEQVNSTLFQGGRGRNLLTTASVALKIGNELHVVNVGDSPIYLIRGSEIREISSVIMKSILASLPNGAVGLKEKLNYKYAKETLQPADRLVVATDGLFNNIFPEEVAEIVKKSSSPDEAVSTLKELVEEKRRQKRGRPDTFISWRFDDQAVTIRYFD